jgi:transposase-like protein
MLQGSGRELTAVRHPRRQHEKDLESTAPVSERAEVLAPGDADVRARPGRRTVEERHQAVLELMAGKATVDQIARRLGVHAATVEGWRQDALAGMVEALRRGNGKTPRELELERKADQLEQVVTKLSIQKCLLEQALDIERAGRPTAPARSKR